jgi:hypothetical protein
VADISTALEGNHILLGGDHDCYSVFENHRGLSIYMIGNGKKSEDGLMDWKEWGWHNGHISTPPNLLRLRFGSKVAAIGRK